MVRRSCDGEGLLAAFQAAVANLVNDLRRSYSDEQRALHAKLDVILEGQVEILERVGESMKPPDFGCLLDRQSVGSLAQL